jgi:hypothetical protein
MREKILNPDQKGPMSGRRCCRFTAAIDFSSNDATCATKELMRGEPALQNRLNRYCTSPRACDTEIESNVSGRLNRPTKNRRNAMATAWPPEKTPDRFQNPQEAKIPKRKVDPSAGGAAGAVDHRPHESLTLNPSIAAAQPDCRFGLNACYTQLHSAAALNSRRRRSLQCEICSPYRACAKEYACQIWLETPYLRATTHNRSRKPLNGR